MSVKRKMAGMLLGPAMAAERLIRKSQFRTPLEEARSILILEQMLPLGCCVHLTPLYEAIRASRPDAIITVATRGLGFAVLRHNPSIDHLIETPDPFHDLRLAAKTLSTALARRNIRPDCVLTGASDQRTRIGVMGLLASGGWRAGFTQSPALYHRALATNRQASLIANNLRLATLLGCEATPREPRVFFSRSDLLYAKDILRELIPRGRPLAVFVTQSSGKQRTGWHRGRFARTIRHAHLELGCAIAYVGTEADAGAIDELQAAVDGIGVSLAGRTSVTQLAALLAMSDYIVSLDTGTMHVGRAVGVPMVVLGPSWQKPIEWLPLDIPHVRILRGEDRDTIPAGYQLDEIEAEDAIRALTDLFTLYPASWALRAERVERSLSRIEHASTLAAD